MDITYTNKVFRVRKYHKVGETTDIVSVVELSFLAQALNAKGDPIFAAETVGVKIFDSGDEIDAQNFTHFNDLSEEQVVNWALSKMSSGPYGEIEGIKRTLKDRLEGQYNLVESEYVPWNNIDMNGHVLAQAIPWDLVNTTPDEKVV